MSIHRRYKHWQFPIITLCVLLTISCSNTRAIAPKQTDAPASPTEPPNGLSSDAITTLNSLEQVDDYPFYVMHFRGAYHDPNTSSAWTGETSFGCSLFAALSVKGDKLYGRNFDWEYSPAMLVFTDPPDGYASASMVDLTFIGIQSEAAKSLMDLSLEQRKALLDAPAMPFDGMNEFGLAVGMAALPDEYVDDTSYDTGRATIGSIGIIRQVLDHARNVDEAVEIFEQYNLSFRGGPPIHYLLADRDGTAVLIEFYKGEMVVLPNESPWHVATNHMRCIAEGDGGCWRYRILLGRLTELSGQLDKTSAMKLLSEVKQENTQWSTVYDMTTGDIHVAMHSSYKNYYSFHLPLVSP